MNRETITVVTPVESKEVVLKAWITGREKREITASYLDSASVGTDMKNVKISAETVQKLQDKTFELIVVSVAGSTDNIVESILDMRSGDYDFIVAELNKVTGGEDEKVKK